jgi:RNA polymerase II-associated protein 1
MSQHGRPLVGSIFERRPRTSVSAPSTPKAIGSKTGFPTAQHRSKSVFARNREVEAQQQPVGVSSRVAGPPVVQPSLSGQGLLPSKQPDVGDWRAQMSEENERHIAAMTEEEREESRREIEEKFGKNIGDVLKRVRMAREVNEMQKKAVASLELDLAHSPSNANSSTEPSAHSGTHTRQYVLLTSSNTPKAPRILPPGTLSHPAPPVPRLADFNLRRTAGRTTLASPNSL